MNWQAYHERLNNHRHVTAHARRGHKVLEVERTKVQFLGRKWNDLSDHDKRKFETNLFLEYMNELRIPLKIIYV